MRPALRWPAVLCAALALHAPAWAADPTPVPAQTLEEGAAVERELEKEAVHVYRIEANAGECLRFDLEQYGMDVALKLVGPGSNVLAEFQDNALDRPERWSFIVASTGEYLLEVRPTSRAIVPGRYSIRLAHRGEASGEDRLRVTAESAYLEAQRLRRAQKAELLGASLEKYEEALRIFTDLDDVLMQSRALFGACTVSADAGANERGLGFALRLRTVFQQLQDRRGEARALSAIAVAHRALGDMPPALQAFQEAVRVYGETSDRSGEAWALRGIGMVYSETGEPDLAVEHLQRALPIFQRLRHDGEGDTRNNLGFVYQGTGEYDKASQAYAQALSIFRASGYRIGEGVALNNIGEVEHLVGEPRKALEYYKQAHAILQDAGSPHIDAVVISNMGAAHQALDEHDAATVFLNQALELSRKIGSRTAEATALHRIGEVRAKQGALQPALEALGGALRLFSDLDDRSHRADVRLGMGNVLARLGRTDEAIQLYAQTLGEMDHLEDRTTKAAALHGLARALRAQSRLEEAQARSEEALSTVESLRAGVIGQERRASFLAAKRDYYDFHVDLLMARHGGQPGGQFAAEALRTSERARGRGVLEILTEARKDLRKGVDPALLDRERRLQRQLNAKAERLTRLLGGKHTVEMEGSARAEVESLLQAQKDIQGQIRASSPGYAALTQPVPLTLKEIQEQVLDDDSLLLEYALGPERSYVWAVTRSSMESHVLPARAEIEALARRVHELLEKSHQPEMVVTFEKQALSLSRMVLGPVAGQLGRKRIIVVAEGALQYVSFAALPSPSATRGHAAPLVVDHEIVSLPSASALAVLRREVAGRTPAAGVVAVLADPVLDAADPRVRSSSRGAAPSTSQADATRSAAPDDLSRSAAATGFTRFERLRWSRTEAQSIMAIGGSSNSLGALDFTASRATAQGPELAKYRIVHFATHGLLNSQHPELSGVVLSLVDEQGRPQDGFLRLHEIYNLELNADLVVLSACRTALGKDVRGEGLVGLTRGFWYAGAPRVVASLWDVRDRATAELMRRFYEALLKDGLTPAAALRAAQVSMWKDKRWRAPHYWAGFVLQGEWK
jgi:CHAT domain-containing protein/tetratricopeptide (TPR) repeat protein